MEAHIKVKIDLKIINLHKKQVALWDLVLQARLHFNLSYLPKCHQGNANPNNKTPRHIY